MDSLCRDLFVCPAPIAPVMSPTHCVAWQLFRISALPLSSLTSHHGLMLPWQPDGYCSLLDSYAQCGKYQTKAGKQVSRGAHSLSPGPQRSHTAQNRALGASVPLKSCSHPGLQSPLTHLPSKMIAEYLLHECQQEKQIKPWLGLRKAGVSTGS